MRNREVVREGRWASKMERRKIGRLRWRKWMKERVKGSKDERTALKWRERKRKGQREGGRTLTRIHYSNFTPAYIP